MEGNVKKKILAFLCGLLLLPSLLTVDVAAQGPYSSQIQVALRSFLTQAHTWLGTQTFTNVTVTGTCTNCGTGIAVGTQYGLPYFTTTTLMASTAAGTTTTVLHGNASGAPSFGQVSLSGDVTGNLGVGNLDSGTSADSSHYWRGDGHWATISAPSGGCSAYTYQTGTYGAAAGDAVGANGTFSVTLPAASSNGNKWICVANVGTGTITLARSGSDTIGQATSQTLNPGTASSQGDSMQMFSDGTSNWVIW